MTVDAIYYLYLFVIITYFVSALSSLLLKKIIIHTSAVSYILSAAASLMGIFLAIIKLTIFKDEFIQISFNAGVRPILTDLAIDNLSAFFLLIICVLALFVSIYSIRYSDHYSPEGNTPVLTFLFSIFILSLIQVVTSNNLFYFLFVWEIMSLTSYFLVVYENAKPETRKAGALYIIMTHIGTAFLTSAFILIYIYSSSCSISGVDLKSLPEGIKNIVFIFTLIGFGTKAGIIPLHTWLPAAHPAAPSNISAMMSGVMIKTAVYGLIRIVVMMLGAQNLWWGILLLTVGAVSAVLGISYALIESNIKRLLAYSSVENIGIIFIGLGCAAAALSQGYTAVAAIAMTALLFHTLNHSLFKGLLFMGAGAVQIAAGTKDMEKLGGLIKKMPVTAVCFLAGSMAISSLPPFNGFVSEWLTYQALFAGLCLGGGWVKILIVTAAAILGMTGVLAAYSFIKLFGITFLGVPRTRHAEDAREVPGSMLICMVLPAVLCLSAGLLPMVVIKLLDAVNLQTVGTTVSDGISGIGSFVFYNPIVNGSAVSPLAIFICAIALAAILLPVVWILGRKTKTRVYGTWDCGYAQLGSRMQYTATGFTKPLRIVFRAIFRPQRELVADKGTAPYFIKTARYSVTTQSVIEKAYEKIAQNVNNLARRIRFTIQTGSVHTYLIYIFIAIVTMLVYYART